MNNLAWLAIAIAILWTAPVFAADCDKPPTPEAIAQIKNNEALRSAVACLAKFVQVQPTGPAFGAWLSKGLKAHFAYKAESDGFVAVYSGGNSPAKGADILTGPTQEALATRVRVATPYGGAITPVPRGKYWLVRPWEGGGSITLQWLPVATR